MTIAKDTAAAEALGPVTQRIELLDVLRGFALLGVLLANMFAYSGWVFLDPEKAATLPAASFDAKLYQTMVALIEAKFYSLFSLLFGLGFAVMLERFEKRSANPAPLFLRRYTALFLIGLVHAAFIFHGDILMLYGLLGFALLVFKRQSVRALVIWAISMLLLPIILYGIGLALLPRGGGSSPPSPAILSAFDAFKSADYARIVTGNIALNGANWLRRLILMFYPRVFAMFLLGFALGKMGVFREPARHDRLLRAFAISGVLIGLPSSILFAVLERHESLLPLTSNGFIRTLFESIGTPLLSLGYVAWITFLCQSRRWQRTLLWLAPVGRTALSNYLLQGIFCMFLFYGIGGGLFMRVSLTTSVLIALGFFAVEAVASRLWLGRFSYGPLEWVWRQMTYWKRVPLRRAIFDSNDPRCAL
jgi:uncharacterized protein